MQVSRISKDAYKPKGAHATFWDYYFVLSGETGGGIPNRADFDPLKVPSVLHKMAVSEFIDEDTQLVRLIGGGHDNLWPVNMAGKNLFDFLDDGMKKTRQSAYREIVENCCGCVLEDEAIDTTGHSIAYKGLVLPTLSYDGKPTIFIGCYDFYADDMEMQAAGEAGIERRETKKVTYIDLKLDIHSNAGS